MGKNFNKRIVLIGSGVSGINAATKLLDMGYPGNLITILDKGQDPYNRPKDELMLGFNGGGGFSDGKLTYHTSIGGQLSKYCGEEKAMELMDQVIENYKRFHPNPSEMFLSDPKEEPDFIKPYFNLRLFPVWHIGTDYLQKINENWYKFLCDGGVRFHWQMDVQDVDFEGSKIECLNLDKKTVIFSYDKLLFGAGKSGIELGKKLAEKYNLPTEPKAAQVGVRFEAPQKYFQEIIDVSYDFKLYQKPNDQVSLRSFCLPGSEMIYTNRGGVKQFISIEEITKKDEVLTYDITSKETTFQQPKTLFNREYKGDLITVNNKLTTTEDHLYFKIIKTYKENLYERKDGYSEGGYTLGEVVEVPAKELKIGDRLLTPSIFPKLNVKRFTEYSDDYLYLFGLWFADGSGYYNSKYDIKNFNLTNEHYILNDIVEILEDKGERFTSFKEYSNYSVLNFYSPILKGFLLEEGCFVKGKNRGLPKSIFNWSEDEIYSFLSGLIDGDGRVKKEHNVSLDYFTSSDKLYRDLTYIFNHLGINFKSRTRISDTNYKKNAKVNIINISQRNSIYLMSKGLNLRNVDKRDLLLTIENATPSKNYGIQNYEKVTSLNVEYYEGEVYDLEIDSTHNFIAGNTPIVIHNCTNNNAAYVAVEQTYGDVTYNGHAKKGEDFRNDMTNFGILMEIKGIENPFEWSRNIVDQCQNLTSKKAGKKLMKVVNLGGLYYSPNKTRKPTKTDEDKKLKTVQVDNLEIFEESFGVYADYITNFIKDMDSVFNFGDDWGIYIPEVKYLSPEPLVNYEDLSLVDHPNVYFVGDVLSARGISVSGAQAIYTIEHLLKPEEDPNHFS